MMKQKKHIKKRNEKNSANSDETPNSILVSQTRNLLSYRLVLNQEGQHPKNLMLHDEITK